MPKLKVLKIYFPFSTSKTILTDIEYSIKADYLPDIEEIEQFPKLLFISGEDDEIIPYTDS